MCISVCMFACMYVAWGLDVKHLRFLAFCIRRTPDLRWCIICKNMRLIHAKLCYVTPIFMHREMCENTNEINALSVKVCFLK